MIGRIKVLLVLGLCVLLSAEVSTAQTLPFAMDAPTGGVMSYDPSIPTPQEIIGHVIGTRHTVPHQVEAYFRAVSAVSDRVHLNVHAQSYEGRNLIHAIVTSPTNHARLDEIRAAQVRVSDDPGAVSDEDLEAMPVVLYQGYSVHGNEASGTEAAVLYLYHLAAGIGPGIDEALENAVIILDPMFNPDGRDRFGDWVNRNRGGVATIDSQDREHNEPWPGGRTNHYWFDLNRDWMVAQHPESQGRMKVFHSWRPHILTDHHEMGGSATFFFQPGIPSRTNPNTPALNTQLTAAIAEFHAVGLDEIGSSYYSEESYDDFFYGKGSAFPDINGGIGILFEQASSRALRTQVSDGELHYAFTVRNQFVTSLTTLEAGVSLRMDLLRYQRGFYTDSRAEGSRSRTSAYILDLERGRTRAQLFTQLMQRHRVEFYELSQDVAVNGRTVSVGNGYVIPTDQPQYRLIRAFTEQTLAYEDSLFYDVSTWTLPLAFDIDLLEHSGNTRRFIGAKIDDVTLDGGEVVGGEARAAYLMPWNRMFAPRALNRIQEEGIDVRLAHKPFSAVIDGERRWFDRGTIIVPLTGRDTPDYKHDAQVVHDVVRKAARKDHVSFYAANSGLTPDGPDLGGGSTSTLRVPKIAVAAGSGVSSLQAGEAWHAISERFQMPVSMITPSRLASGDLERYNTIILPGGSYTDQATEALKAWTRSGGTLIVLAGATGWADTSELIEVESLSLDMDSLTLGLPYHKLDEARGAQRIGGSIFQINLDTSHPLGYGMPDTLPVFHQGSSIYSYEGSESELIGAYSEDPLMSGYLSKEKLEQLPGSASVIAKRMGRGRVIAFMERLNFRAYWYGSQRLFFNSIYFGSSF